jgi:hypothetical protein
VETFDFAFDPRFRPMLLTLGVTPRNSEVILTDDDRLVVRFGHWRLETPLSNVCGIEVSGDYRWWKAIGIRSSLKDRGITFGSNTRRGVCTKFTDPVPGVLPGGLVKHPGMTVTVADPDRFVAAIEHRVGDLGC